MDAALIDVTIIDDPRLVALPRSTRLLQLEAYVWCRAHRTDGHVPRHVLARIAFDEPNGQEAAETLVASGLWAVVPDGFQIVNFLDTQMSRARVERKRQQGRERYDRWQEGAASKHKPRTKRVSNARPNGTGLTRPDPTRQGGGEGGRGDDHVKSPGDVRSREERVAVARELLANPATADLAKRPALRQLKELGEEL